MNAILSTLALLGATAAALAQQKAVSTSSGVTKAFESMRAGRGSGFEDVIRMGDPAVGEVAKYLHDRDVGMRSQAVMVLRAIGSKAACEAMVPGLSDASGDNRERTARSLYQKCRGNIPASAATQLRTLVQQGTAEATAILLLAAFPDAESRAALESVGKQKKLVHLENGLPVAASLAAKVAGGGELGLAVMAEALADRLFLLAVLPLIQSPKDLTEMASYLDDVREIRNTGVPSGAGPKRRLCDEALEALAKRKNWKAPFALDGTRRYSDEERSKAKAALAWS